MVNYKVSQENCLTPLITACVLIVIGLSQANAEYPLTILHTNDVHSRFLSWNDRQRPCEEEDLKSNQCWGGAARRMTALKKFRRDDPNVLVLDAGDQFQGTLWYTTLKWEPIAQCMNMMQYDAMAFGNHEFDDELAGLEPFVRNLSIPIVNGNIEDHGSILKDLYKRSIVLERGNEKIGIVGCTTVDTVTVSKPGPQLEFRDEVESLQPEVEKLITSGINKIVVLSHAGIVTDRRICQSVKGVDIVVGGHTHTFLWSGEQPSIERPEGPYPEVYENAAGHKCLVVQAYAYGKYLGRLKVKFDDNGILKEWTDNNPVVLDAKTYPEDEELAALLRPHQRQLEHFQKTVIANTAVSLDGLRRSCRMKECNLGNILADSLVYFYTKKNFDHPNNHEHGWTPAAIGLWNGGGMRDFEAPPGGNVTLEDLYTIMPFQNTVDKISIKGRHLKEAFEHAVADFDRSYAAGKFLQVSGVKVVYDLNKPNGERVKRIQVRCNQCPMPRYGDLIDEHVYQVVTHTYVSDGGDGFMVLKNNTISTDSSNMMDIDVVMGYMQAHRPLMTGEELRIEFDNGTGIMSNIPFSSFSSLYSYLNETER